MGKLVQNVLSPKGEKGEKGEPTFNIWISILQYFLQGHPVGRCDLATQLIC